MASQFVSRRAWLCAVLIISSLLLPWAVLHLLPDLRTFLLILAPQLWQAAMRSLTQRVLFLLLNLVIVCIWITSNRDCCVNSDVRRDARVQSIEAAIPEKSSQRIPTSSAGDQEQYSLKLCKIEMAQGSRTIVPVWASIADAKEKDAQSSQPSNEPTRDPPYLKYAEGRRLSAPDKNPASINARIVTRQITQKLADADSAETRKKGHKSEQPCRAFPSAASSVIVKSMSAADDVDPDSPCAAGEAMVIDKDELNDRIEAFFAKFRQQLMLQRQESLRRRQIY